MANDYALTRKNKHSFINVHMASERDSFRPHNAASTIDLDFVAASLEPLSHHPVGQDLTDL
jgi:hypothetical protein